MVRYVDAAVAVTVVYVLLFVFHVCMLKECEGDSNAVVVLMSAGHVGSTRGSGTVSSTAEVLGMRGVCEMCMCLARGSVGGEGVSELGFTNPVGTGRVLDVSQLPGGNLPSQLLVARHIKVIWQALLINRAIITDFLQSSY